MEQGYLAVIEQSVKSVLGAMAGLELTFDQFQLKQHDEVIEGDSISSVISLNGADEHLSLALTFPKKVILAIAQKMLPGIEVDSGHPMVVDLAGEMANMVLGGTKNSLDQEGDRLSLSLPVMVTGKDCRVEHKTNSPVWMARIVSELGMIFVEVSHCKE